MLLKLFWGLFLPFGSSAVWWWLERAGVPKCQTGWKPARRRQSEDFTGDFGTAGADQGLTHNKGNLLEGLCKQCVHSQRCVSGGLPMDGDLQVWVGIPSPSLWAALQLGASFPNPPGCACGWGG